MYDKKRRHSSFQAAAAAAAPWLVFHQSVDLPPDSLTGKARLPSSEESAYFHRHTRFRYRGARTHTMRGIRPFQRGRHDVLETGDYRGRGQGLLPYVSVWDQHAVAIRRGRPSLPPPTAGDHPEAKRPDPPCVAKYRLSCTSDKTTCGRNREGLAAGHIRKGARLLPFQQQLPPH